jgi:tRNA-binding protein
MTTLFYNKEGIGDVLILDLLKEKSAQPSVERKGDWAVVRNEEGYPIGFNLFNASTYFEGLDQVKGKWTPDQEASTKLQSLLSEAGFKEELVIDSRPDFIVGFVEEKVAHPDADKLNVCQVNLGEETVQIVCGAPNVEQGQKVVVARVGAVMPDGLIIKDAVLRGVASSGMICSARELGLPNAPQKKGILVLTETAKVGSAFSEANPQRS